MTDTAPSPPARPFGRPLSPPGRTGPLVVGVVAAVLFVVLQVSVALGAQAPLAADLWWHDLMRATLTESLVVVAWIPGVIGGTVGMIVVGLLLIGGQLLRGRRADAVTLAIAMVVVVAIGAPMAAIIARVRPEDSLAESVATSFPSGHTAVTTTVVVVLSLMWRSRYVWLFGGLWVAVMMWSRTYLQAHWLSDVVAGLLEGIAVACLVWCAVQAVRDRRAPTSDALATDGPRRESRLRP